MLQQKKGWGENVIVMYTCKDNLTPLLFSGKIKKNIKKIKIKKRRLGYRHTHREDLVKIPEEDSHLQAKEKDLRLRLLAP